MEREPLVQDFVEASDAYADRLLELLLHEQPFLDEGSEIYASEETAPSCRQGFLGAGVGTCIRIVGELAEKIPVGYAVPEQTSGLSVVPIGAAELFEERVGVDLVVYRLSGLRPLEFLNVCGVILDRTHELVRHTYRHVGLGDAFEVRLHSHELLHVRMFAGYGQHEGAAAAALSDKAGDHGIKVCEGYGPGGLRRRIIDLRSPGRKLGEVYSGPPAVAEGSGQFSGRLEY